LPGLNEHTCLKPYRELRGNQVLIGVVGPFLAEKTVLELGLDMGGKAIGERRIHTP